jgi:hypothetical protein
MPNEVNCGKKGNRSSADGCSSEIKCGRDVGCTGELNVVVMWVAVVS